jgi:hypothetical protein
MCCVEMDRRRNEPKGTARECEMSEKEEVRASGRVEWIVVGSDGLVRNARWSWAVGAD